MYCRECGKILLESDKFCSRCGNPVEEVAPPASMFVSHDVETEPASSYDQGERTPKLVVEAPGSRMRWNTNDFPDSSKKKKREEVRFQWSMSDEDFRKRPNVEEKRKAAENPEPSLWANREAKGTDEKAADTVPVVEEKDQEGTFWKKSFLRDSALEEKANEKSQRESNVGRMWVQEKEEEPLTGKALEQELFRDMQENQLTEAQKMRARQTEQIDKFYTFNKKNEEFQALLDREYEKFQAGRQREDLGEDLIKLGDQGFYEDHSWSTREEEEPLSPFASQVVEANQAQQWQQAVEHDKTIKLNRKTMDYAVETDPAKQPMTNQEAAAPDETAGARVHSAPVEEGASLGGLAALLGSFRKSTAKTPLAEDTLGQEESAVEEGAPAEELQAGVEENQEEVLAAEEQRAPLMDASAEDLKETVEEPVKEQPEEAELPDLAQDQKPEEEAAALEQAVAESPLENQQLQEEPAEAASQVAQDDVQEMEEKENEFEEETQEEVSLETTSTHLPTDQEMAELEPAVEAEDSSTDPVDLESAPVDVDEQAQPCASTQTPVQEKNYPEEWEKLAAATGVRPMTAQERARLWNEERAAAWDAFFNDEEDEEAFGGQAKKTRVVPVIKPAATEEVVEAAARKETPNRAMEEMDKATRDAGIALAQPRQQAEDKKEDLPAHRPANLEAAKEEEKATQKGSTEVADKLREMKAAQEEAAGSVEMPAKKGSRVGEVVTSILAIILVLLLCLILIRLVLPDSFISIKLDDFTNSLFYKLQR